MVTLPWTPATAPHFVLEITQACNIDCRGCYKLRGDRTKPLDAIVRDVDLALAETPVQTVSIAGAEPTLHPDLVEVVRHLKGEPLQNPVDWDWQPIEDTSGEAWTREKDMLLAKHRELMEALDGFPEGQLDDPVKAPSPDGEPITFRFVLQGLTHRPIAEEAANVRRVVKNLGSSERFRAERFLELERMLRRIRHVHVPYSDLEAYFDLLPRSDQHLAHVAVSRDVPVAVGQVERLSVVAETGRPGHDSIRSREDGRTVVGHDIDPFGLEGCRGRVVEADPVARSESGRLEERWRAGPLWLLAGRHCRRALRP